MLKKFTRCYCFFSKWKISATKVLPGPPSLLILDKSLPKSRQHQRNLLIHFWPMLPFYTPWKYQKTKGFCKGFLVFSGSIKWDDWAEMAWRPMLQSHRYNLTDFQSKSMSCFLSKMLCAICYHLHNLKNAKDTHVEV